MCGANAPPLVDRSGAASKILDTTGRENAQHLAARRGVALPVRMRNEHVPSARTLVVERSAASELCVRMNAFVVQSARHGSCAPAWAGETPRRSRSAPRAFGSET